MGREDVKEYLAATATSQSDLARLIGIDQGQLSRWLSGATRRLAPKWHSALATAMRAAESAPKSRAAATDPVEVLPARDGATSLQATAEQYAPEALAVLVGLMRASPSASVRFQAAQTVLAHAAGRPRVADRPTKKVDAPAQDRDLLEKLERIASAKSA